MNLSRASRTLSQRPLLPNAETFSAYCGLPIRSASYFGPPKNESRRSNKNENSPDGALRGEDVEGELPVRVLVADAQRVLLRLERPDHCAREDENVDLSTRRHV